MCSSSCSWAGGDRRSERNGVAAAGSPTHRLLPVWSPSSGGARRFGLAAFGAFVVWSWRRSSCSCSWLELAVRSAAIAAARPGSCRSRPGRGCLAGDLTLGAPARRDPRGPRGVELVIAAVLALAAGLLGELERHRRRRRRYGPARHRGFAPVALLKLVPAVESGAASPASRASAGGLLRADQRLGMRRLPAPGPWPEVPETSLRSASGRRRRGGAGGSGARRISRWYRRGTFHGRSARCGRWSLRRLQRRVPPRVIVPVIPLRLGRWSRLRAPPEPRASPSPRAPPALSSPAGASTPSRLASPRRRLRRLSRLDRAGRLRGGIARVGRCWPEDARGPSDGEVAPLPTRPVEPPRPGGGLEGRAAALSASGLVTGVLPSRSWTGRQAAMLAFARRSRPWPSPRGRRRPERRAMDAGGRIASRPSGGRLTPGRVACSRASSSTRSRSA